jgi:predicted MFS family arabinose efflux permease
MSAAYKRTLLVVLLTILAFNNVDRVALGVVQESIKADLALSDTQLGLLNGMAFALFYSLMGIPIARWADRGNRITIITVTTVLWSLMVALSGAATSFLQLMLVRVAVSVGEAGTVPPSHSLIAEHFGRGERARAVALYMQGPQLAMVIGYFAAGWLNELTGWRTTFVAIGLPGIALSFLAWKLLYEPRNRSALPPQAPSRCAVPAGQPSLRQVARSLWANKSFKHLCLCFSVWYFFGYGLLQWEPTFFIRTYALSSSQVGMWFALLYGVIGGIGVYIGGEAAARFAARNERLQLLTCALGFVLFAGLVAAALAVENRYTAFAFLGLASLGGNMCQGPMLASLQSLVAPRMRAMSIAIVYLLANLIGLGLGPLAAGALSDALHGRFGADSLRYALLILCPGYLWAAWHLWRAAGTVTHDAATVQQLEEPTCEPAPI